MNHRAPVPYALAATVGAPGGTDAGKRTAPTCHISTRLCVLRNTLGHPVYLVHGEGLRLLRALRAHVAPCACAHVLPGTARTCAQVGGARTFCGRERPCSVTITSFVMAGGMIVCRLFTREGGLFTREGGLFTRECGLFTWEGISFTREGGVLAASIECVPVLASPARWRQRKLVKGMLRSSFCLVVDGANTSNYRWKPAAHLLSAVKSPT